MTVGQTVTLDGKTTVLSKPTTIGGPEGDLAVGLENIVECGYCGLRCSSRALALICDVCEP